MPEWRLLFINLLDHYINQVYGPVTEEDTKTIKREIIENTGIPEPELNTIINEYVIMPAERKHKVPEEVLNYLAYANVPPLTFTYNIMHYNLTENEALEYLTTAYGHKYSNDELKNILNLYYKNQPKPEAYYGSKTN